MKERKYINHYLDSMNDGMKRYFSDENIDDDTFIDILFFKTISKNDYQFEKIMEIQKEILNRVKTIGFKEI